MHDQTKVICRRLAARVVRLEQMYLDVLNDEMSPIRGRATIGISFLRSVGLALCRIEITIATSALVCRQEDVFSAGNQEV